MKNVKLIPVIDGRAVDLKIEVPRPYVYESPLDKLLCKMVEAMRDTSDALREVKDILRDHNKHIKEIYERIDHICPDYDLLKSMAKDDEDFCMLIDLYMSRNETAAEEISTYREYVNKELERVRELDGESYYDEIKEIAMDRFKRDKMTW